MKKIISIVLILFSFLFLSSCGGGGGGSANTSQSSQTNSLLKQTTTTIQVTYDNIGRIIQEDLGNGKTINYQYDENDNIISISHN